MNYLALAALEKNAANFLGVDLAVEPWSSKSWDMLWQNGR